MLQDEFIKKCKISEAEGLDEYQTANALYMTLPDDVAIDNDRFCELYRVARKYPAAMQIIDGLMDVIAQRDRQIASVTAEMKIIEDSANSIRTEAEQQRALLTHAHDQEREQYAVWMIRTASQQTSEGSVEDILLTEARHILGERKYYAQLLLHGCPDEKDMREVARLLSEQ